MGSERDPAFEDWVAEARAVPILDAANERGARVRGGSEKVGPCPACGGHDRFGINVSKSIFHCRGSGTGGDVISLVQYLDCVDFLGACERLTGRPPPRGASTIDLAELARRAEERRAKAAQRQREADRYREDERRRSHRMWKLGEDIQGTPVEAYLALRQVTLPPGAAIRYLPDARLYAPREKDKPPVLLHVGPAMIAAIIGRDGRFAGLHMTWIDLNDPEGKARVIDPETGELVPAKKVRGSQKGGRIEILRRHDPRSLVLGEGIEEIATVLRAIGAHGWDLSRTAAWSGINLHNIGGAALDTVVHPTVTLYDKRMRVRAWKVPNDQPDMSDEATRKAIPIPDSVDDLVLLGDGDSDRFLTEMTMNRAARRYAREGRSIRVVWSPEGRDWNKLLREAAR